MVTVWQRTELIWWMFLMLFLFMVAEQFLHPNPIILLAPHNKAFI